MLEEKDLNAIQGLIRKSEGLLIDEMERYDRKNERRYDELLQRIQETQSNNETIQVLLKLIENLEKRVAELERKSA